MEINYQYAKVAAYFIFKEAIERSIEFRHLYCVIAASGCGKTSSINANLSEVDNFLLLKPRPSEYSKP